MTAPAVCIISDVAYGGNVQPLANALVRVRLLDQQLDGGSLASRSPQEVWTANDGSFSVTLPQSMAFRIEFADQDLMGMVPSKTSAALSDCNLTEWISGTVSKRLPATLYGPFPWSPGGWTP